MLAGEGTPASDPDNTWMAISVLQEAGAVREREEHGWMQDRADPHARERALVVAREDPPCGISSDEAVAAIKNGPFGISC
jgi:hypothetical protein